jgi:ATP-binding cassette, subfamily C, bacterial CydC
MPLPEAFRLLGQIQTAAKRLFSVIDRVAPVLEPASEAQRPDYFDIEFNHVFFRYHESSTQVLSDVNFKLSSGKKLAIVGPTGSGKTSLIQLLLHYREPQSGEISFGARPLADYRSEQLHDWIAVVPQQVHLFNTTIRNNLLLAKPDTTEDELNRVCSLAQLDDFIQQQPDGLDTWVGETGIKVSGGQARRIAIARALLRDFECLILDEPGEGLDSKTEAALISGLIEQLKDKSLLLITHTKTGLDLMDEVIEFKTTG